MFPVKLLLQIPLKYIFQTVFRNEKGVITGIKEIVAFFYISFLRFRNKSRHDLYDLDEKYNNVEGLVKLAVKIPPSEFDLEHRRQITGKDSESVLVYGGNIAGSKLLVRISRTPDGLSSIWIHLKLDSGEEYYLPTEQFHVEPKTGKESFVGGGLRIKCIVPMRRWRITFNGFMRKKGAEEKTVHVRFGFWWITSSSPQDVGSEIHTQTLANFLAEESNWNENIENLTCLLDRWVQIGNILGVVQIPDDGIEDREVFLWGARKRNQDHWRKGRVVKTKEYICYFKEGESLYFGEIQLPSAKMPLQYAFVVFATSLGGACKAAKITEDANGNTRVSYSRGPFTRYCVVNKNRQSITLSNGDSLSTVAEVSFVDAMLEGYDQGHGIVIENQGHIGKELKKPQIRLPRLVRPSKQKFVLPLTNEECRLSEISGGKGSSLAELTILSKENAVKEKFQVPTGVVVTTTAYDQHIKDTQMSSIIQSLENVARESPDLLQESCKFAVTEFQNRPLFQNIKDSIKENLEASFGNGFADLKFAVRSSASGEDSEELSAAGQMTTYLGVQGLDKIYEAIVKCWASQFSFVAIQYKRQNGQILNSPMAVVIQEMIPADVAGVLFTCDPVTGNPARITITANYGIGESVVSAAAEPDTIIIGRDLNGLNGKSEVNIGKKSIQIVLSGNGGVKEESLTEELSQKSSLSIEDANRLAEVAILIEQSYGIPVDVEWGFYKNQLFLLQARPITTFEKESDFEISHESDSPLRSELEYTSTANVGEVLPGAFSYLGINALNLMFQITFKWHTGERRKNNFPVNPYFLRSLTKIQNHTLFNLFDSLLRFYHGKTDLITDSQMISMFGRILDDDEMFKQATRRNEFYPPNSVIEQAYYIVKDMILSKTNLKKSKKRSWNVKLNLDNCRTSAEFHDRLWTQYLETGKSTGVHVDCTISSSICNLFLLSILQAANKGWGPNVFRDFAYVLSSSYEVESADVPNSLEKLSETISKCTSSASFKNMETQDALNWLNTTGSEAGVAFRRFLQLHGHRCYKEFDIYSTPWGSDPLPLVKTLQSMANSEGKKDSKKEIISIKETISNLAVPLDWKKKLLACIAIPLCRRAVGLREQSKSVTIKIMDKVRVAYRQMGDLMVREGRLPDRELIFFFSNEELDELIKTRSPALIQKAIRRRALFPTMNDIKFPEISRGYPVPINYAKRIVSEGSLVMKGTPVSTGIVEGLARVATTVEEASHLQNGEILIAYSTDIGWSPFFPMLGGVATELGGLVSHGAVVAREYGLPCVVGLHGATIEFKTGDRVLLNGNKGTLERIDN